MSAVPRFDAATHVSHPMHADDADWPETNCYVDLFVELLYGMGLDPVAGMTFVFSAGFDGEQWEFFKYPQDDLRVLYGVEVHEINAWRPLLDHIEQHFELGHFLTVEADSWFLPDTAGVSYRLGHQKSSIAPVALDAVSERMTYVHNRGCFELEGEDFRGVLQLDAPPTQLPPYVEVVDVSQMEVLPDSELRARARRLLLAHLDRRPRVNPIVRLGERVIDDLPWLRSQDPEVFHGYAFGSLRQLGAWAECAARFSTWFDANDVGTAEQFSAISRSAKSTQFLLARAARGRDVDLEGAFESMGVAWDAGYRAIDRSVA